MVILHIVTGLNTGGAESALYRLVMADRENAHRVVSLLDMGTFGPRLSAAGVAVHAIGMSRERPSMASLAKLFRLIREIDPDVVQTWMYHADLAGGSMARVAGKRAVVWGIRNGCLEAAVDSTRTRLVARLCAKLSVFVPQKIVVCSAASAECHAEMGYSREKMIVIPNGYDTDLLKPDLVARERMRAEWDVSPEVALFGMVARWHPAKDHATLASALSALRGRLRLPWSCVLVGRGMDEGNRDLVDLLDREGLRERVRLAGERTDVAEVMNALDLHLLSSVMEAFPNVLAEAMACGTPCVATRVGDAATIVAETGWIVPPSDAVSFADAIIEASNEMTNRNIWGARRAAARLRVIDAFGVGSMVQGYRAAWAAALKDCR